MSNGMLEIFIDPKNPADAEIKMQQAAGILYNLRRATIRCDVYSLRLWEARADEFLTELQEEAAAQTTTS